MIVKTLIIKFGGSVITNKAVPYHFNAEITRNLSQDLVAASGQYVLVHGAGSFGHPLAKQFQLNHGISQETKNEQLKGAALTHHSVRNLNGKVIDTLLDVGIPAVSISPFPFFNSLFDVNIFTSVLKLGFTPVTFGDVVLTGDNVTICSGDYLMKYIALALKPEKAIFVTDVDGIFIDPQDTSTILTDTTIEEVEKVVLKGSVHTDVTRGMAGKIEEIKSIVNKGIEVSIINGRKPRCLLEAIRGNVKGTRIRGGNV
jgi:isopentenyl phosphate kinase